MPVTVYHRPKGAPAVGEDTLRGQIATAANISEGAAARVLDALQAVIATSLHRGGAVSLNGFGSFHAGRRAARNGRNPRTGEAILIPAATVPPLQGIEGRQRRGEVQCGQLAESGAAVSTSTQPATALAGRLLWLSGKVAGSSRCSVLCRFFAQR
ncbi:MAG: HU family DNA-binding protein [Betaproteobacteria bacterium]|nr:HU family DNA-binding protein [Betaproteobacteria bacterium]